MNQFFRLFLNGSGHAGVTVAEVAYSDAGGEIQIFIAVSIPETAALSAGKEHLRRISGHNILAVTVLRIFEVFHSKKSPELLKSR